MAAVAGLRLPQLQLRDGRLPLLGRPLLRRLRRRRLPRPNPPLPLPPPARAQQGRPTHQARRLGPLHAPHAHVLIQGRRHHAALGAAARLGHGDLHHRRGVLRLLPRTPGRTLISACNGYFMSLSFQSYEAYVVAASGRSPERY